MATVAARSLKYHFTTTTSINVIGWVLIVKTSVFVVDEIVIL